MSDVESILREHTSPLSDGVAKAACSGSATCVVEMALLDRHVLTANVIEVVDVCKDDGVVVWYEDQDSYWTLPDEDVPILVARLVRETDYIVLDGDDTYCPPLREDAHGDRTEPVDDPSADTQDVVGETPTRSDGDSYSAW